MKREALREEEFASLQECEMESISGGAADPSLGSTLSNFLGAVTMSIIEFGSSAMEYQQSLPANLKK